MYIYIYLWRIQEDNSVICPPRQRSSTIDNKQSH